jgi:iron complex outermembrane recepter protein
LRVCSAFPAIGEAEPQMLGISMRRLAPVLILGALGGAHQALRAQEATEPQLPEIVVTAQKRSSTADKTPISMSAVSGEDLQERGIASFSDLAAATPGVSMKTNGPGQTEFEMRGMTSGGGNSPTVGFYLDDVPLTSPAAAQNGKVVIDPSLYDLNRVEVLRGPQGTLYGAGSMGGTVKLVTHAPEFSAFQASAQAIVSATEGGGLNGTVNAMINAPLLRNELALRIVATDAYTSGWIDRIVAANFPQPGGGGITRGNVLASPVLEDHKGSNAERLRGGRIALTWKPTERLTITPSVFYQRIGQDGPSVYDGDPGTLAHYQPFSIPEPYSDSVTVNTVTVGYRLDALELSSTTAYWHRLSRQTQDGSENFQNPLDGFNFPTAPGPGVACVQPSPFYGPCGTGPVSGIEVDPSQQLSEEIRAVSLGEGPLQWVGGFFFSDFKSDWQLYTNVTNPAAFSQSITNVWTLDQPTKIRQSALFGEASYAFADRWKATGGLRWYTYQNDLGMSFSGFGAPSDSNVPILTHVVQSNSGINPKFNVSYEPDRDTLWYATAARGFRPGGGNQPLPVNSPSVGACIQAGLQALGYAHGAPMSYAADSLWSFELGEKAKLLDGRLRLNTGVYFENWKDIQLEELPCNYPMNDNANSAHIYGGELELRALLTRELTIAASAGYSHAQLAQSAHGFNAGDRLPDVPQWTADVNITWRRPCNDRVEMVARLENVYTGSRVDLAFPGGFPDTQSPLAGYDLTHARLGLSSDTWSANLFVSNLFDRKAALENVVELTLANAAYNRIATNQPRTIGLDLSYRF